MGGTMSTFRVEKDSMGEVRVPAKAYYGAQSQRAMENFPVSGERMPLTVVHAVALVKGLAAEVNAGLGILPAPLRKRSPAPRGRSSRERSTTSSWSTSSRPAPAPPRT